MALPEFLARHKYQDVTDNTDAPHQLAFSTPLPMFEWLPQHPKVAASFNEYMLHRRNGQPICWDVYPVEQECRGLNPSATVLVDIGGNKGHQCAEFKRRFPGVPGKVVLEDLPGPLSMALSTPGVENRTHDMFTPQPIKGTFRAYTTCVVQFLIIHRSQVLLPSIYSARLARPTMP